MQKMQRTPADRIRALISETEAWQRQHKANRDGISAAACAIRLVALRQALDIVEAVRSCA